MNRYRKYKPPLKWFLSHKVYTNLEPSLRDVSIIDERIKALGNPFQ